MDPSLSMLLLAVAAFGAGVLNAVAGGGSFLTFPALVFTGVPPIVANATSALAVSPGYLGSTLGFRSELLELSRQRLRLEMLIAAIGGVLGALLLLVTPEKLFSGLVPWLLLFATLLFALGPMLSRKAQGLNRGAGLASWRMTGLFVVAVYGGYFNGGLGILLMALYTVTGESKLNTVNALKNLNSLVLSWVSVGAFIVGGVIAWSQGIVMMLAATVGGYFGARLARRLPAAWVRVGVILTGLGMSAVFFMR
jgi:uncharacterized membrane protein YfcA